VSGPSTGPGDLRASHFYPVPGDALKTTGDSFSFVGSIYIYTVEELFFIEATETSAKQMLANNRDPSVCLLHSVSILVIYTRCL
jgi:hypothetical protein